MDFGQKFFCFFREIDFFDFTSFFFFLPWTFFEFSGPLCVMYYIPTCLLMSSYLKIVKTKLFPASLIASWASLCLSRDISCPFTAEITSPACNPAASPSDLKLTWKKMAGKFKYVLEQVLHVHHYFCSLAYCQILLFGGNFLEFRALNTI